MQVKVFNRFQKKQYDRHAKARKTNLPILIEMRYGIEFSGKGNHLDARGNGLRLTNKNGEYVANGSAIGDSVQTIVALEKQFKNLDIKPSEAIKIIEDFDSRQPNTNQTVGKVSSAAPQKQGFKMPATTKNTDELFEYVRSRGVINDTINEAVSVGFCDRHRDGIMFVGRDSSGVPMNAEIRLMRPDERDGKQLKFRCVAGSDRSYPPIFNGKDKSTVHIVEGGFSALGLREKMNREGKNQTIIVTGGKDNTSWLKHEHVQKLIKSNLVFYHAENERNETVQQEADLAARKQCEAINEHSPVRIHIERPPTGIKDCAEFNLHEKNTSLGSASVNSR